MQPDPSPSPSDGPQATGPGTPAAGGTSAPAPAPAVAAAAAAATTTGTITGTTGTTTGPGTPDPPGAPARYQGGSELRRYATVYGVTGAVITALWGATAGILLPNQVQLLEFGRFFTGADSGVDLAALTDLGAAVSAGTATATAEQQRLLGVLTEFDAARAASLSLVTAVGVGVTMLVQPVVGSLSDRTRSRYGRRAPWIVGGTLTGAALVVAVRYAPSVAVLVALWALAQAAVNAGQGPLNTTLADRVPVQRRGGISAVAGLGVMLGGTAGGVGAGVAYASMGLDVYWVAAAAVALCGLLFVTVARDRSSKDLVVPPGNGGLLVLRGAFTGLRDRDFRWVWTARVILAFGYAVSTAFALYMLQSYVRPALSAAEATALVPVMSLCSLPGMVVAIAVAGRLSDRIGRRKPFVVVSSLLLASSMVVPLVSPSVPALFAQAVIGGIAYGVYLPVDQALFVDVLPDPDAAGRDLGIAALGNNFGQALGPVLAGQVVVLTGGYGGVLAFGAVLCALAALVVLPVRRVR